jgi:uncharacterized membrane protein
VLVLAIIIAYAGLSIYSDSNPSAKSLATSLSIGPILLIGLALLWRWCHRAIATAMTLIAALLLYRYWPALTQYYRWSDLIQQCGAYVLVTVSFAYSLTGGRVPLCTQISERLHGALDPAEMLYLRRATFVWAVFYAVLAATILALFFLASARLWTLFVNFATYALIGAVFLADHAIRRRVLPPRPGGLLAAIRHSLTGSA